MNKPLKTFNDLCVASLKVKTVKTFLSLLVIARRPKADVAISPFTSPSILSFRAGAVLSECEGAFSAAFNGAAPRQSAMCSFSMVLVTQRSDCWLATDKEDSIDLKPLSSIARGSGGQLCPPAGFGVGDPKKEKK